MALIDLSHTVEDGLVTYPGLPAPAVCDYLSRAQSRSHYAPGTEFQIGRIDMVANTGTYIDSPFHRYADGHDIPVCEHLTNLAALPQDARLRFFAVPVKVRAFGTFPVRAFCIAG